MENGMILLAITTALTSLATEGVKKTLHLSSDKVSYNILVLVISVISALLVGFGYIILADIVITAKVVVYLVALTLMSALAASTSYDKLIQTLKQLDFLKNQK